MSAPCLCEFCDRAFEGYNGLRRHLLQRHNMLFRRGLPPRPLEGEELQRRLDALYEQHQSAAARGERARRSAMAAVMSGVAGGVQPSAMGGLGIGRGRGRGHLGPYPYAPGVLPAGPTPGPFALPAASAAAGSAAASAPVGGGIAPFASGVAAAASRPRVPWTADMAVQASVTTVHRGTGVHLHVEEAAVQTLGATYRNRATQVDPRDGIGPLAPVAPHSLRTILDAVSANRDMSAGQLTLSLLHGGPTVLPSERRLTEGHALAAIAGRRSLVRDLLRQIRDLSRGTDVIARASALQVIYRQLGEEEQRFVREADLDATE